MTLLNANNIASLIDLDLGLSCALLSRILGLENAGEFFQCLSGCFDSEEVDEDDFDGNPATVHDVYTEQHSLADHSPLSNTMDVDKKTHIVSIQSWQCPR